MKRKEACGIAEARAEAKVVEVVRESPSGDRKRENKTQPLGHDGAVEAINAELKKQNGSNLKIGEIMDREIGPTGRADYGREVFKTFAEDPDLQCSAEFLRQCWHYYRLMRDYGGGLSREFPELKFGHLYQISRLLQLEEGFGADVVKTAIHAMASKAMIEGKGGKPIPADTLAKKVTTHLKSIKGRGNDGSVDGGEKSAETVDQQIGLTATQDDYTALNDGIEIVQVAAGRIAGSGQYNNACELQTNVERIAQAYLDILGLIVRHDPNSLVISSVRRRVRELATLVGLTVVEASISSQGEVSP